MEGTDKPTRDDNSLTTAAADGLQAALYTGIQQPYDSVRQIAGAVHIDLPELNIAAAPAETRTGSTAWFAETIGGAIGMLPLIVASHKMVRAGSSFTRLSTETSVLTASGMGIKEAGLTGATYSTLFQPVQNDGNFMLEKAKNAGIGFGTFAVGAGLNNALRPLFGSFSSGLSNRLMTVGTASLSAFGAGVVDAEANNLAGNPHQDALETGMKFAVMGGVIGATSKNYLASEAKSVPKNSDIFFGERPAPRPTTGDFFGPRTSEIEKSLNEVKSRYGENSQEVASTLVQLGDAHMVQGRLSNPNAKASYEQALGIFNRFGEETPQTAWVYDKLANVKQSSGDTVGAANDLAKAEKIWRANSKNPNIPDENYINRRTEDLARMQVLNNFNNRRPPEIKP
ncbi:MAG: hypothetical protein JST89_08175 [Cyanobacteria bacterium SZAS-4]|nr:hypothetical protein [Cyanobacteria bacterium SZAS-4]